jgi:hypothetical protein
MFLALGAIVVGLVSAFSSFQQSEAQRRQQNYEAEIARNNAIAKDQQAELVRQRTESERIAADKERHKVKRKYLDAAGTNMSLIAARNVGVTGSALDILEGNLDMFADDMGEMAYQKEINTWMGRREAQVLDYEAEVLRSNASSLERTAGSVGQSLLTGGLSGLGTGLSAFSAGGGLFGSGAPKAPAITLPTTKITPSRFQ